MAKRVLVVEHHPPTVALIREALEAEHLDVCSAGDGGEGLIAVAKERPDLVVLDVTMPILDGFQALSVLRQGEKAKEIPVVLLTGRKEDQDRLEGWSRGMDLYLTKPFQIPDLVAAVRRLLEATETPTAA